MIDVTELFGYVASFFVAISLLMNGLLPLRILNLIGATSFVIYGTMLPSIPILITNAFIVVVDVVYLVRMLRPDLNGVRYVAVGPDKRSQLDDFLAHNLEDILKFFPDFSTDRLSRCFEAGGRAYVALKDLTPVGFALVQPVPPPETEDDPALREVYRRIHTDLYPEKSMMIPVDYVTRKYRGLGLVHQLYSVIEVDERGDVAFLLAPVRRTATKHQRFLRQVGYQLTAETGPYVLFGKSLQS
ncbi:MAG: hypothetical protein ACOCYB_05365 [Alkalispirochaeta sp.]